MAIFNFPIFTQLATYLALSLNSQEDLKRGRCETIWSFLNWTVRLVQSKGIWIRSHINWRDIRPYDLLQLTQRDWLPMFGHLFLFLFPGWSQESVWSPYACISASNFEKIFINYVINYIVKLDPLLMQVLGHFRDQQIYFELYEFLIDELHCKISLILLRGFTEIQNKELSLVIMAATTIFSTACA